MYCQLQKPEVNYFKSTILVSNEFGRSVASANMLYVSPDENLYHFQTYAGNWFMKFNLNYGN